MKTWGAIFVVIGSLAVYYTIWAAPLIAVGFLMFLQGSEQNIVDRVVRCLQEDKTPEDLEAEEDQKLHEESGGY